MLNSGISCFCDFREFGIFGINQLKEAVREIPVKSIILGRDLSADELNECDGLGLNLYNKNINKIKDKILAIHAGEAEGEVEKALKYRPDIVIHATKATDDEIKEISEKNISVVCCPRSNLALGCGIPKIRKMLDSGINVLLGTDNVMVNSPCMWREMAFTSGVCRIEQKTVLRMATINPATQFKLNSGIIREGRNADLIFIGKDSINLKFNRDWISVIVNRCETENVRKVMIGGRLVVDKD
jgi:cytosine/adenosine deaminase-related metal-dependent hydrolase